MPHAVPDTTMIPDSANASAVRPVLRRPRMRIGSSTVIFVSQARRIERAPRATAVPKDSSVSLNMPKAITMSGQCHR